MFLKCLLFKLMRWLNQLFKKWAEPETNEDAILNDYLRIQDLRREEERRFRQFYWGRFE